MSHASTPPVALAKAVSCENTASFSELGDQNQNYQHHESHTTCKEFWLQGYLKNKIVSL